jgi:hypothetical protein
MQRSLAYDYYRRGVVLGAASTPESWFRQEANPGSSNYGLGALFNYGTGAPPSTANQFAPGALYLRVDGTPGLYYNSGTLALPVWTLVNATAANLMPYALAAAGTALTNSVTETVLAAYAIPANTITTGPVVRVTFQVIQTASAGAITLQLRLRLGPTTLTGTSIITGAATTGAVSNVAFGQMLLTGRAVPSGTSAVVGTGSYNELALIAASAQAPVILASANFATNGILHLELTGKFSSAAATESVRADNFIVEIL